MYLFPRAKFVDTGNFKDQLQHIISEVDEVAAEYYMANTSWSRIVDELNDVRHSVETALRIIESEHGQDIAASSARIYNKNKIRGYYD